MTINPLDIDFNKQDQALQFLYTIKSTRVEGLIIESFFQDVFNKGLLNAGYRQIDCMILNRIVTIEGRQKNEFLVMPRNNSNDFAIIKKTLEKSGDEVKLLQFNQNNKQLFLHKVDENNQIIESEDITPILSLRGSNYGTSEECNKERIDSIYHGYGRHLGIRLEQFCQELVIKDNAIKASYLWDFDKFYITPEGTIIYFEIKHKYPTWDYKFGLNVGEKKQIDKLIKSDIKSFYIIMVKPYWNKDKSSMYLFFDKEAREKSTWIAGDLSEIGFFDDDSSSADRTTSIFGSYSVGYFPIKADKFSRIGNNSETSRVLTERLINFIKIPQGYPRITVDDLKEIKM